MFLGHFGAAFALKRLEPKLSLGTLFLAVEPQVRVGAQERQGIERDEVPVAIGGESQAGQHRQQEPAGGQDQRPGDRITTAGTAHRFPGVRHEKADTHRERSGKVAEQRHVPQQHRQHHAQASAGEHQWPPAHGCIQRDGIAAPRRAHQSIVLFLHATRDEQRHGRRDEGDGQQHGAQQGDHHGKGHGMEHLAFHTRQGEHR